MGRLGLPGMGLQVRGNGVPGGVTLLTLPVAGAILHLRADTGITQVGADVSVWRDQSGNWNDATQATPADQPAFSAAGGPNGTAAVEFDESNTEFMNLVGMTDASNDYTVFAVIDQGTFATAQTIQHLLSSAAGGTFTTRGATETVGVWDGTAWRNVVAGLTGEQMLTWRLDSAGTSVEVYRDGTLLGADAYDATWAWLNPKIGSAAAGSAQWFNGLISELIVFPTALSDADVATVHAYLAARYALAFSPLSVADCGAWWDLDNSTQAGGVLLTLTDLALADTINVVGAPAIVAIGGQDYVRMDGINDVLWIADKAALDGALGNTFVLKHANAQALPTNDVLCLKGATAVHSNGGMWGQASAGTRFSPYGNVATADPNKGPLAEFTTPAETIAMAFEGGVAIRRVDGDGTYASTATALTTAVGAGGLTWGGRDDGVGGFDLEYAVDLRAATYYNRPINEYELQAVRDFLEAV